MPEVQEVFRMATEKVKPDPNALERQVRRQRKSSRSHRARAYLVAAAVIVAVVAGAIAILQAAGDTTPPAGSVSPAPTVFTSTLPGGAQVMTPAMVDLHGRTTSTIPGVPPDAYSLSYAANGSTVAFIASDNLDVDHLGVIDSAGGTPRMVPTPTTLIIGSSVGIGTVAISPDGTRLAFEAVDGGNTDIYVVNVDGSDLRRLTTDEATDQLPQWSPDGATIVYDNAGAREDAQDPQFSKTAEIYTVPADGSATPTQLTHNQVPDAGASFSPDGARIAFLSGASDGLWTMAADGGDAKRVSPPGVGGFTPRWSPDGSTLAFTDYSDAYRPMVALGSQYAERPLVLVALLDLATGRVTELSTVGMASDYNTPQWAGDKSLLVLRVPATR
jgi:dipeptidyl aminopeptidase/acylaminoacyl peptidase